MLKIVKHLTQIPPVFTDGFLITLASFCAATLTYMATEEAYKYVNPALLFWLKLLLGSIAVSINQLVAFRSKVYSQHAQQLKADATGVTQVVTTQPTGEKQ